MPREARVTLSIGVFHTILRGVNKHFIQYSHSKNLDDYLYFLATLYAHRLFDVKSSKSFADALFAVYNQIGDYKMEYEYKIDIEHYSCLLASVLYKMGVECSGISVWKEVALDSEQFRDVRSGWLKGETMVVKN